MVRAKKAVSLGIVALILVAIIIIVGFGVFLDTLLNTTETQQTTNTSSHFSEASSWQVLKPNVIVSYNAECLVLGAVGHTCPTTTRNDSGMDASSLRGVELVAYQGTDYYAGSFSVGPYGPASSVNTPWYILFTNSTIFCVTPAFVSYVACPFSEPLPSATW
ncbi:MAG: hypothetical protein ABSE82_03570 [Nitrososphaerales archaeon]|jgi:hypothetical protein